MKNIKWIIGVIVLGLLVLVLLRNDPNLKETEGQPLKVAAILPLTGPAAFPGEEAQDGMLLAIEEINKKNTIIHLVVEDSKTKPVEAASIVSRLESSLKPDVYISALSSVSMAVSPLAEQFDVPLIGIFTYASEFTKQNENSFRFFPPAQSEIPVALKNLDDLASQKVGILHLNDDYGNSIKTLLEKELKASGKILVSENFLAPDQDLRTQLHKLNSEQVDSIYVVGFDANVVNALNQSKEVGYEGNLLASIALPQPSNLNKLDASLVEGARSAYPKMDAQFEQNFFEKYGYYPGAYALNGYAALYLIADNLFGEDISSETLRKKLNNIPQGYQSVAGPIYQKGQEIPFDLYPVEIQNGQVVYK